MQIFISKNGQRYGPYSLPELRREVHADVFRPEDFASADNCRTWTPIHAVPGIGSLDFAIAVDESQNLLAIRYHGEVRAPTVSRCARAVEEALARVTPGFRLLVDFTGLESMEVACAPQLERIMQLCNEHGVSEVVRIIPNPRCDIGLRIMSCFHYAPEVRIATCGTPEEAQEILAGGDHSLLAPEAKSTVC